MTYGDGDGSDFIPSLSLDVVAHELLMVSLNMSRA
jgi:Zn-dependent metalloprotease